MASGAIGPYTFATFSGDLIPANGTTVEEITRPGVAGVAYRQIGRRGEVAKISTVADVALASSAAALAAGYRALQGTQVAVTDAIGVTWDRVIVVSVMPGRVQKAHSLVGGLLGTASTGYLVACDWQLMVIE